MFALCDIKAFSPDLWYRTCVLWYKDVFIVFIHVLNHLSCSNVPFGINKVPTYTKDQN